MFNIAEYPTEQQIQNGCVLAAGLHATARVRAGTRSFDNVYEGMRKVPQRMPRSSNAAWKVTMSGS